MSFFKREFEKESPKKRTFKTFCKTGSNFIEPDDFQPFFKNLLTGHPGLEFLQATPEFQDRYADTVIMRIFYMLDLNDDSKITFRDYN